MRAIIFESYMVSHIISGEKGEEGLGTRLGYTGLVSYVQMLVEFLTEAVLPLGLVNLPPAHVSLLGGSK